MPATLQAQAKEESTPVPVNHQTVQEPQRSQEPSAISQLSVFKRLPSELILDIFSYLDIVTIFRFLDTCRHHRYLLLNLPEIWRRVRFIPLSEYSIANSPASLTALSAAAAVTSGVGTGAGLGTDVSIAGPSRYIRPVRTKKSRAAKDDSDSSSGSESGSDGSDDSKTHNGAVATGAGTVAGSSTATTVAHRLKHAENERDRERGGSRTLISEIYAVLRRFRKENRLVDFVREINMDSTDSQHFPSPLVMLIKFPNLHTLSSRYRRNQTSLTTDTHTLKDLLRNGDILPHSLKLRKWDVFHPYMANEDVVGFKAILDAISVVGGEAIERRDSDGVVVAANGDGSGTLGQQGVTLDIHICPGPIVYEPIAGTNQVVHAGGGMHWATSHNQHPQPQTTAPTVTGSITSLPTTSAPTTPADVLSAPTTSPASLPPPCTNIVWTLEKCRVCDASQDRCYRCVGQCRACGAIRVPPFINHQTLLGRERARQTSGRAVSVVATPKASGSGLSTGVVGQGVGVLTNAAVGGLLVSNGIARPRTPPGSISLSQMANAAPMPLVSAHYASTAAFEVAPLLMSSLSGMTSPPPVVAPVALVPEFSLFD
ncbi:hypothetical protein BGZ95_011970 [Linnemannia exigua]|uniref:F-box domain-containing protein n=1 Tax=Linnemannia exigua TaxID=604196 RepID=A0AAD4DB91_9FUNG|nr:hypothetical protein BGZ95_011970 [Linnemannia exigua]